VQDEEKDSKGGAAMKLTKIAAVMKQSESMYLYHVEETGQLFVGANTALYRMPDNFPAVEGIAQLAVVLGIREQDIEGWSVGEEWCESIHNVWGLDLADGARVPEVACEESSIGFEVGERRLLVLTDKNGGIAGIDRALLAPMADEMRNSAYIQFFRRGSGVSYYVLKDGFDLRAVFMPTVMNYDRFLSELDALRAAWAEAPDEETMRRMWREEIGGDKA